MPISFECADCGTGLKVKDQLSGRKIKCPHCDAVNRVPSEDSDDDDDDVVSQPRSSRSKQSRRRSRSDNDDGMQELPQSSRRKKKKTSQKSESASGGKVPVWAIVAGSSLAGVVLIAVIVFVVMKPSAQTNAAGGDPAKAAEKPKVVQAQVDGPGAKFRMKFEMPLNWTSEGAIEDGMFPWANLKGQGQSVKLSSNRSLLSGAETITTKGFVEKLKMSHTLRGAKLQQENTDWVEGQLTVHEGKQPVVWSEYEYKGVFGKGYGIRCTVVGPVMPCTLMLECAQGAREKWRPTLLTIAESIHYVKMKNGQEEKDGFDGPDDMDE